VLEVDLEIDARLLLGNGGDAFAITRRERPRAPAAHCIDERAVLRAQALRGRGAAGQAAGSRLGLERIDDLIGRLLLRGVDRADAGDESHNRGRDAKPEFPNDSQHYLSPVSKIIPNYRA